MIKLDELPPKTRKLIFVVSKQYIESLQSLPTRYSVKERLQFQRAFKTGILYDYQLREAVWSMQYHLKCLHLILDDITYQALMRDCRLLEKKQFSILENIL